MTEWHKWDDKNPPPRGSYLVTLSVHDGKPYVISAHFDPECPEPWGCFFEGTKVLAWAELPKPYSENNSNEWHKFPEEMPPEDVLMYAKFDNGHYAIAKLHKFLEGYCWCYEDGSAWPEALNEKVRFFRKFEQ